MQPLTEFHRVFAFGDFELRERPVQLRRRGSLVELRHQCLELLLLLVERSGQAVGRDEIRQRLWARDHAIDHQAAINTTVSNLRHALGDDRSQPRYIETLPKRGYCFIAPVTIRDSRDPVRRPSRLRGWLALLSAL